MDHELVKTKHQEIYGEEPELVVFAPGRINLIGEHTDYSEGFVLPMAINMGITLAISKIPDSAIISVYSVDFDKKMVALYSDLMKSQEHWFNYPVGIVKVMQKRGLKFGGVRLTFTGNIPQGAGLASSAALEIAVAYAIDQIYTLNIPGLELAKICQRAEHEVVGVRVGIMDQYISRMGKANTALFIDCRTLKSEHIPFELAPYQILITNSNVPRRLANSKYNERVFECQEAVKILESTGEVQTLRDVSAEDFEKHKDYLSDPLDRRVWHVISENARVLKAKELLKAKDLEGFGKLLQESHQSLKENFEVSCDELDWLVGAAVRTPGCYGARMVGAGFGGCTIALLQEDAIKEYKKKLEEYETKFGLRAVTYDTLPMDGVSIIWKK
ncbi:MAG: galactokinase [Promethearchaeota archaeon]